MKPGQRHYYLNFIPDVMWGLTLEESIMLRKLYERVGRSTFYAKDIDWLGEGVSFKGHKYAYRGYLDRVGINKKGLMQWKIRDTIASRFELDYMIQFEPYKYQTAPFNRVKLKKKYLFRLGMTLDQNWYYCRAKAYTGYDFVMCSVSDWSKSKPSCFIYAVDWEICRKWQSMFLLEGPTQGDFLKSMQEPGKLLKETASITELNAEMVLETSG